MADLHLQLKRKTAAELAALTEFKPVQGEPVFEYDTGKLKIGDGNRLYKDLPYLGNGGSGTTDYNDLNNKPIINCYWLAPGYLSSLSDGYALVSKYYYIAKNDTTQKEFTTKTLVKTIDKTVSGVGKKVVSFELFDENNNSTLYVYEITFTLNTTTQQIEETYTEASYSRTSIVGVSTLPAVGKNDVIYAVSGNGLYVYKEGKFHQIGDPSQWVENGF